MDGFDVGNMAADQICDVDGRTATYLVIAGYAVRIRAHDDYPHHLNRRVSRNQQSAPTPPDSDFRDASHGNGRAMPREPHPNGRAPMAELSAASGGAGQQQSRPEETADERQIAEPMEE